MLMCFFFFFCSLFFLMIRRPPRSTLDRSSAASDVYKRQEYSCPYLSIGAAHAEVCTFDKMLMDGVLQLPVQQESCMLHGADRCQFTVNTITETVSAGAPPATHEPNGHLERVG